jgi:hypothetical protein
MLEVLAKTPGSSSVDPPFIHLIEEVVDAFFKDNPSSDDAILTDVKTVLDLVTRLLHFEWICSRDQVKEGISGIIVKAEGMLQKRVKEHREVGSRLLDVLEDLEKPWRLKMREQPELSTAADYTTQILTYADWKTANVKWLCNPRFFAPSCCPTMQVGKSGVYDSAEHYMETIHRLWVAMTFADGHAALAPHCRTRGQAGVGCNNALWPVSASSAHASLSNFRCRSSGCSRTVEFACRIKSHDALCGDCATRSVARHLGGPGQSASTHVYDCKVKHVQADGVLYLVNFKSRNPPPSIHWRTTKRLSPPNLVAIVQVRSKGAALNDSDRIKWGEIVYHGHNRDEDRRREAGDLAVNISSIEETDPDFFEEGAYVAVVSFAVSGMTCNFAPLSDTSYSFSPLVD